MRATSTVSSAMAAAAAFSGLACAFDATAKTNVVAYWGQGPNQGSLQSVCANPNIDIAVIAFVDVFPDQGAGGWPGTNFGNACGSETYTYNGTSTQLLSSCGTIGPDIEICQQIYGTKVLLSIGGGYPVNYYIDSDTSASNFAKFLWGAFGPSESDWTSEGGPRPFGDAVVDGFDFDIESEISPAPVVNGSTISDYQTRGYATMISTFKNTLFPEDTSKDYYISGAPQCIVPDAHLSTVVEAAWFDFLFVQYYNTASCSARSAIASKKRASGFPGYDSWSTVDSYNSDVKIYMGLPASTAASGSPDYYLEPSEVQTLVQDVYSNSRFGGIMLWEATYAANNVICDMDYATWMKKILDASSTGTTLDATTSPCPAQPISKDGTCGRYTGYTCIGSIFGDCCSEHGYCGNSTEFCSASTCDTTGGSCDSETVAAAKFVSVNRTAAVNFTSASETSSSQMSIVNSTVISSITISATAPVSASACPTVFAQSGALYSNSSRNATASSGFPTMSPVSSAPYGNCSSGASSTGNAVGANAAYAADPADVVSTIYVTSVLYTTVTRQAITTNAQGEQTVYVTVDVTTYTTVYPTTTMVASQNAVATANSDPASTSTSSHESSSASAVGGAKHAANYGHGHGHNGHAHLHGHGSGSRKTVAKNAANAVPTTETIYTTEYMIVTIVAPSATYDPSASNDASATYSASAANNAAAVNSASQPQSLITETITTTYAIATTVIYYETQDPTTSTQDPATITQDLAASTQDSTTSITTTVTTYSTIFDTTTVMVTPVGAVAEQAVQSSAAAPFAYTNSSSVAPFAYANSTTTQLITATAVPVASPAVAAAAVVPGSGSNINVNAFNGGASVADSTGSSSVVVPVANITAAVYNNKKAFASAKQADLTSGSEQTRAEAGVVAIALLVGVFLAL